ncbi:hypothetical protein B7C42_01606 [Nocardia cerradoensis]|uniref:Phage recombination protein Bet n=1 Tax=Nocardia cerradoensis TaxID=85688 RepID=A0A231HCV5_9NOCA|nr:recombinase RecT [Nocardia cerradoensis]OXR46632.1 hypothetical protein B7C42_01606 [Nocardia cerradoensis]
MTTTEIALRGATRSALAITPDQNDWTPQQIAALRQLGIEDAPEGDLLVFRHVCMATGLDPFRKQIYMIGRKTKVKYWDDRQKKQVEDWVMKYTIQTGIDGFRKNGRAAAKREGEKISVDGPYWQGADGGGWHDVWLSDKPPAAAKFVIFRDGEPHTGIAMYREFVQTAPGSTGPNTMWAKMPANQLAKCAEAQAWRRAYPDDFAGMQLEDAAQIIDPDGAPADPVRAQSQRVTAGEILAGPASNPGEKPDTAQAEKPATRRKPRTKQVEQVTAEQLTEAKALFEQLGVPQDQMRAKVSEWLGIDFELDDVRRLTKVQGDELIADLTQRVAKLMTPATTEQIEALTAALVREKVTDENEQLTWVRNSVRNPDLQSLAQLTGTQAEDMTNFLIEAQAADERDRAGAQQALDTEAGAQ